MSSTSTTTSTTLLKVLAPDGHPLHGGYGAWTLPVQHDDGSWTPGAWREVDGDLVAYHNGLHLTTPEHLLDWDSTDAVVYEAEVDGELLDAGDTLVARRARLLRRLPWDDTARRHFAADCAEHVLHLYERQYPGDTRPRRAIEAAWAIAHARSAYADAADAASHADARAAERAWQLTRLEHYLTAGERQ